MLRRALEGLAGVGVGWPAPRRCLWSMRRYARSGRVAPSDRVESSRSDAILPIRWNLPDGRVLSEDLRRESASPMPPPLTVPGTNPQPIRFVQWPGTVVRRRSSRPQWLKLVDPSGKVLTTDAGWSSSVARRAHNPEVAGSNPVPATTTDPVPLGAGSFVSLASRPVNVLTRRVRHTIQLVVRHQEVHFRVREEYR